MINNLLIATSIFIYTFYGFGMGSSPAQNEQNKKVKTRQKKILVHVLESRLKKTQDALGQEVYKTILDEVLLTENFSLLMNKPKDFRQARIKFLEIHSEIERASSNKSGLFFNVGLFMADGNTGTVIKQETRKFVPESGLRFFIRKTLRNFFYEQDSKSKKRDPDLALSKDVPGLSSNDEVKKKNSTGLISGSSFTPLFEKNKKRINLSGSSSSEDLSSQYSRDSLDNIVPYTFRKKKPDDAEDDGEDKNSIAVPANNLKKTKSIMNQSPNQRTNYNPDRRDGNRPGYGLNFGMPEMMSRQINKSIEEYATDKRKFKEFSTTKVVSSKKELEGEGFGSALLDMKAGEEKEFKKTYRKPGDTVYSLGINFMVDKIESSDRIKITNNFKQIGLYIHADKFMSGDSREKISGNFVYATPIDFDESFTLPSSMKAMVGYHKAFSDNILGVLALEYEKQFFVNVARTGESLQAWSNTLIWYNLGLDLEFSVFSNRLGLSAYFSKPFIGNTNYGGDDTRTMDGSRVYGKIDIGIYKTVSLKAEVIWSEMTSQGISQLKNTHLTSATYLVYGF